MQRKCFVLILLAPLLFAGGEYVGGFGRDL